MDIIHTTEFTTPDKSASFFCKVYFAEEFHRLRQLIFPSGEVRFVRSLARCVKYDAKGGKSRSMFCKVAGEHLKVVVIVNFTMLVDYVSLSRFL